MRENVLEWLLEEKEPSIRYRTLTELLDYPDDHADVISAKEKVAVCKTVECLFAKQDKNGLWDKKDYGGMTELRYLTAFTELGLGKDSRLDKTVDQAIDSLNVCEANGDLSGCVTPLILRALVMLGYHDREDVMTLIEKFAEKQLYDGGYICKRPLDKRPDRKSCFKATFGGLLFYAECKRKSIMLENTDKLIGYFMKRNIFYYQSVSLKDGRFGWRFVDNFFPVEPMRIGLPLFVSAFAILGASDQPGMKEAWEMLHGKEDENGKFNLDGTLSKQPCKFGTPGEPNKWVTLYMSLAKKERDLHA